MEQVLNQILSELKNLNNRIDNLESKVDSNNKEVMSKLTTLENKLDDLEPKNATIHTEILDKIDTLSKDLVLVEAISSKNMSDIAHLKLIK